MCNGVPHDARLPRPVVRPVQVGVLTPREAPAPAADAADVGAVLVPPRSAEGDAAVDAPVVVVHVVRAERSAKMRCQ